MAVVAVLGGLLALVLTSCPANRDRMPGRLATAKEEIQSAVRSGALALQLWDRHRATAALTSVQLTDARDDVVKAYQGIAVLKPEDSVDLSRQQLLTGAMNAFVADLNTAEAAVRGIPSALDPPRLRQRLLDGVDALERAYR